MPDMLVKLFDLPSCEEAQDRLEKDGICIRRAMVPDMYRVLDFVEKHSGLSAKGEATVCFSRIPVSCFIATRENQILGYACYEATSPDFFGPTRVLEEEQGKGIGKVLLIRSLEGLRQLGYAYAIIGGVGPQAFYEKSVGAVCIPNSDPGIYKDFLPYLDPDRRR
jgi:GNAT superfamily N-acetyltransferase